MKGDSDLLQDLGIVKHSDEDDYDHQMISQNNNKNATKSKHALFMVCYMLNKNIKTSKGFVYFASVLSTFQLMYLTFGNSNYKWNENMINTLLPLVQIANLVFDSGSISIIFCFLFICSLIITFSCIGWICFSFLNHGTVVHGWIVPLLRVCLNLQMHLFFLPIVLNLGALLSCDTKFQSIYQCDTGISIGIEIISLILLIVFIVISVIISLLVLDNNPDSSNYFSKVHGRVDAISFGIRGILGIGFVFVKDSTSSTIPYIIAIVLSGLLLMFQYLKYLPFLKSSVNQLYVINYGIYVWAGICLVTSQLIGSSNDYGAFISFFIGLIPFIITSIYLFQLRQQYLVKLTLHQGVNPYEMELVLRFTLNPSNKNWREIYPKYRNIFETIMSKNGYMIVHFASLLRHCGQNEVLSSQMMRNAKSQATLELDQNFLVFQYFQSHREKTGGLVSFAAITQHRKNAENEINISLELFHSLWKTLSLASSTQNEQLFHIINQIYKHTQLAKNHLNEFVKVSNASQRSLQLYAIYAESIMNDQRLAKRLLRAAEINQQDHDKNDEQLAAITISGDQSNLGEILDVTESAPSLFGVSRGHMIGRNISTLCPPPFDSLHDKFLQRYLETNSEFVEVTREIWAKHVKGGFVMSLVLTLTCTQDLNGVLTFTGTFTKQHGVSEFICVKKNGAICFFSKGMAKDLGLRDIKDANIFTFIPNLKDKITFDQSYECIEIDIEDELYEVSVQPLKFKLQLLEDENLCMIYLKHHHHQFISDQNMSEVMTDDNKNDDDLHRQQPITIKDFDRYSISKRKMTGINGSSDDVTKDLNDASSNASGSTFVQTLNHAIIARANQEEARAKTFWKFCKNLTIIFCVCAIASYIGLGTYSSGFNDQVQLLIWSSKRAYIIIEMILSMVHVWNVIIPGLEESIVLSPIVEPLLVKDGELLRSINENILSYSIFDEMQKLMYGMDQIPITNDGGLTYTTSSLNVAILQLAISGESFATENKSICDTSCLYMLQNGPFDLLDGALKASKLYILNSYGKLSNAVIFNLIMFAISSVVALFAIVFRLIPILRDIQKTKNTLLYALSSVPSNVVFDLRSASRIRMINVRKKLYEMNQQYKNVDDDDNDDEDYDDDANKNNENVLSSPKGGTGVLSLPENVRIEQQGIPINKRKVAPANELMKKTIRKKRLSFSFKGLMKLSLPLAIIPIYFGFVYNFTNIIKNEASNYAGTIYYTGLIWVTGQRLHLNIEAPNPFPTWSRWYNEPIKHNITKDMRLYLDEMKEYLNAVTYGSSSDSEIKSIPLEDKIKFPQQYSLQYVDACTSQDCLQALEDSNGTDIVLSDLKHGLHHTLNNFIIRSEESLVNTGLDVIPFLSTFHLSKVIENSMYLHFDSIKALNSHYHQLTGLFCLIFCISITFVCTLIYRLFAGITTELKQVRFMILMLPREITKTVPEIKALIKSS